MYITFEGVMDIFGDAVDRITSGAWTPQEAMDWAQREAGSR
jgi:hypothetical protein